MPEVQVAVKRRLLVNRLTLPQNVLKIMCVQASTPHFAISKVEFQASVLPQVERKEYAANLPGVKLMKHV
jgi:hypothetical protein